LEINLSFLLTLEDSFTKTNYLESIAATGSFARPEPSSTSKTLEAAKLFMTLATNEGDPTAFSIQDIEKQACENPDTLQVESNNVDRGYEEKDDEQSGDEEDGDDDDKNIQAFALTSEIIDKTVISLQRECKKKLMYMMFGLDWSNIV
jgi:hypothetical protein